MSVPRKNRIWLMIFLGVMSAMAPLSTDMYLPALPAVQADLGATASLVQLTLTMTMLGMAIGQLVMGPVSDRYGRRLPLLAGMLVFAAASALCANATDIALFLAFRFVQGFAGASGIVIARAIARDVCEGTELTRFFSLLMMVNGLAPILAPVIGGQILLVASWRAVFWLLVLVGAVQFLATARFRETLPEEARAGGMAASLKKFPQLLHDRYFFGHCLLQMFVFGGFFAYLGGSSFVFQNVYAVSAQAYSLIFAGIGAGLMAVGLLPARLAGRVPDVTMLKAAVPVQFGGSLVLLASLFAGAPLAVIVVVLFVTIVPLSVIGAASFSLALARQGKNAGSASALAGLFQMVLGGALMPLIGLAGEGTALPMALVMAACFALSTRCFFTQIAPFHRDGTVAAKHNQK